MSLEKSELKIAMAHSIGVAADDDLEAAERDVQRHIGRFQAAKMLEQQITSVIAGLKSDQDSDSPPFKRDEDYQTARKYLNACLAKAMTTAKLNENMRLQTEGKVAAFKHTIQRLLKIKEEEETKIRAAAEAAAEGSEPARGRVTGVHPGPSIADQRRAEVVDALGDTKGVNGNGNGNGTSKKKAKKKASKKKR